MRGEILGVERRRYWGDDDKLAIVSAVGVGGATVTQVAQRHDVTRQQIYAWRHELKRKGLWSSDEGALFLPVGAPSLPDLPAVTAPAPTIWIELRLAKGRMLRFESNIDDASLTRLIRAVDSA
ncbi:IS66-like element accessory protein TnpA [Pararhodobacter oceanensis]|uniref:IS66-like element accessory protein TnpA n=1 Tax=Pararhodobacter oceanensis TaxID=2172121 RepID=UPI0014031A1E|nr:transposase [Pararhodobacter oceanensis]